MTSHSATRNAIDRAAVEPRCMTREQAAAYCGRTASAFSSWVSRGLVPGPMPGTKTWDRKALDRALDKLSGIEPDTTIEEDPYLTWRREYDEDRQRA